MQLIDIGVNLTNSRLYHDREKLKAEALAVGVIHQIITGTSYENSANALSICLEDPHYYSATAGCHPHDAKDFSAADLKGLETLTNHECIVAVGECGLDFNRNFSPAAIQRDVFQQQINLALKTRLPLFLHQRDAHHEFIEHLRPHANQLTGVCHCFTGSKEEMKDYLDLGFYIGITGWLCDERRGASLQEAIKYAPVDRLLFETDAPYLLPRTIRPKPKNNLNTAANLPWIVTLAAKLMHTNSDTLAEISIDNANQLFNLVR